LNLLVDEIEYEFDEGLALAPATPAVAPRTTSHMKPNPTMPSNIDVTKVIDVQGPESAIADGFAYGKSGGDRLYSVGVSSASAAIAHS